jgi:GT2 family glycosyltransferase
MMPSSTNVSCSVVAYHNPPSQIAAVLDSIARCDMAVDATLIDNSSTTVLAAVARQYRVRYAHLPHNPGYGAAHNLAIDAAIAAGRRYHVVMNPDIRFSADVLPRMFAYMERHPDIGLLAPRVHYPNGLPQHLCKLLPNPVDLLVRRFCPPLHRLSGRMARYELHGTGYGRVMDVPALSGCFMLLRLATVQQVGAFDPGYFMYFEDVDLSRRIGTVARTVYYPQASIVHDYAKESYRNLHLMRCHIRSAIRYFNKWGWWHDPRRDAVNAAVLRALQAPLTATRLRH